MIPKRMNIGLRGIYLAKVTQDDGLGYTTDAAIALPWAGKLTFMPKENKHILYYDDALYATFQDYKGSDIEIRLAEIDFEALEAFGAGTYDPLTQSFEAKMGFTSAAYGLRFISDTVSKLPNYYKFRNFHITGIREDCWTTKGDNITANEIIISGFVSKPVYPGVEYKAIMRLLEDGTNQAACDTFLSGAEVLP